MSHRDGPSVLSPDQCWEMLRRHELGRLAFRLVDELHIVPVNYVVDHRTLLFRSAAGDKLLSVVMSSEVAFEIDERDEQTARSVVVRGRARLLDEYEAHRAESLPLQPWVGSHKENVVEIAPETVNGRAFELVRPRAHAPAEDG